MVDADRVDRLLDRLLGDVAELRAMGRRPRDRSTDDMALKAMKYSFVTIIEGASRVAQHVVVAQGWRIAETNADAFRRLADQGVLPSQLGDDLARAVGFRNVLVHRYDDVRDDIVLSSLDRLDDFDQFARHVAAWLPSH